MRGLSQSLPRPSGLARVFPRLFLDGARVAPYHDLTSGRPTGPMGKEPWMTESRDQIRTQEQRATDFIAAFQSLRAEVGKVIVGHDEVINHVLLSLFAGGHVLL